MSSFEDGLWNHLVREHEADHVEFSLPPRARGWTFRSMPRRAVAISAGLATSLVAVVLALTVFAGATPAYAFTSNSNGTATVSLNEIATGIPALNQLFAEQGIRETVVPIEASCTATTMAPQAGSGSMSETVTVGNQWIPKGYNGFIAAMQMPNGEVLLAMGTSAHPIPSCFPATPAPRVTPSGTPAPSGNTGLSAP
jgi:hypothetical protein